MNPAFKKKDTSEQNNNNYSVFFYLLVFLFDDLNLMFHFFIPNPIIVFILMKKPIIQVE